MEWSSEVYGVKPTDWYKIYDLTRSRSYKITSFAGARSKPCRQEEEEEEEDRVEKERQERFGSSHRAGATHMSHTIVLVQNKVSHNVNEVFCNLTRTSDYNFNIMCIV